MDDRYGRTAIGPIVPIVLTAVSERMAWEQWLSIYGAGLSSLLAWRSWRKDRRELKIAATPAIDPDMLASETGVRVSLQNRGFEPVHLRYATLAYRIERLDLGLLGWRGVLEYRGWHRSWWFSYRPLPEGTKIDPPLPCTVEPGRNVTIWLDSEGIAQVARKAHRGDVRIEIQDELDRRFRSGRLPQW